MWVAAVKSDFYVSRKWGALRPQNPFFPVCSHAVRDTLRCTKPKIWHVCAICTLVAAVKSDFYVILKLGAWRPKNRQNPVFPVCSHAVRHTLRCRNLKFGMYVPFVRWLLSLRVIFKYFENGALCAPKTHFSCLFTRCTRHPSIYPRMLRIVPILAFTFLKLLI